MKFLWVLSINIFASYNICFVENLLLQVLLLIWHLFIADIVFYPFKNDNKNKLMNFTI